MVGSQQTWFITGASTGFGRTFAKYAISKGHQVAIAARSKDKLREIANLAPDQVLSLTMDINKPTDIEIAVKQTQDRFGKIDVLINNAGYGIVGAIEETSDEELRAVMETNFFGAMSVTRAVLPIMRSQRNGAIVNISSMGGQMSVAGFGAYSASKFALEGASEAMQQELKPLGIKVMIVEPGAFRTNFAGSALRHMPQIDAYEDTVAGTRVFANSMDGTQQGDPEKAAEAIAKALADKNTPLRLVLGLDAIDAVRNHAEAVLSDIKTWESVGRDTAFAE